MSALQDVVIVETAERVTGEYCGKLLADFGARVVKVERPATGSPTRAMGPIIGSRGGPESSGLFAYLNTNKDSVVRDLASEDGRAFLHELISSAHVVIDDPDEDWLMRVGLAPRRRRARLRGDRARNGFGDPSDDPDGEAPECEPTSHPSR